MPTDHRAKLKGIRTFPSLVKYLRDELDWPIESDQFDEITFEYTPEELGLDEKVAAKIQEIKRLRPLSAHQPWGIFFVKFEPKKLPVVALRRILNKVALKKRASANSSDRAAWSADDLLFISNYGEGKSRQISFAHFSGNDAKKDLPTLKVLGWDNLDTALHLDHVADQLTQCLAWPDDEDNAEDWRNQWRSAFTLVHRQVITTSKMLSIELAALARNIRDRINNVLAIESDEGPVTKLMEAFKEALVHDLDEDGFADMYAQTIAYGLLSARVANPVGATADDVAMAMPVTNPFLKELMETFLDVGGRKGKKGKGPGLDFDELGVSEVVDLLDSANMEAVVRDFGDKNPLEDPVIHFYELFLKEYDAKKRMKRGVFYTPRPVVSFIVQSVDELLRKEFGLEDGLADIATWGEMVERFEELKIPDGATPEQSFVQILDPATGTGTFLVEVISSIYKTMTEKWQAERHSAKKIEQLWNSYVPKFLLPRLYGYELMMAPYAIAHMKIGLKLYETGYHFGSDERARVYLTNSLEPPHDFSGTFSFAIPALAHEAAAVNAVKNEQIFTVIVGNPPYASLSANMTDWIRDRVNHYLYIDGKRIEEKSKRNHLQNDYIKFMRIADIACSKSQLAIFGFITSNSYLDGRTLRGLRWHMMQTFNHLQILNLWGDSNKRNAKPGDENVFDITEGVAICIGTRNNRSNKERVLYSEVQGSRPDKYQSLQKGPADVGWQQIPASLPYFLFINVDEGIQNEFDALGPSLDEIFEVHGAGMKSNRDRFATDEDPKILLHRIKEFANKDISDEEVRERYGLKDNYTWKLPKIRAKFQSDSVSSEKIVPLSYRPFDNRFVYYDKSIVFNPRIQIMRHLISGPNLAIATIGQNESRKFTHAFISRSPVEIKMATHYGASVVFPVYLYSDGDYSDLFSQVASTRSNLTKKADRLVKIAQKATDSSEAHIDIIIAHYIYSILYSKTYRAKYAEQFLTDFPRIPDNMSVDLFIVLCNYGAELTALHLLDSSYESAPWNKQGSKASSPFKSERVGLAGSGDYQVEKVSYSDKTVWLNKAKTKGFLGVSDDVWNFQIGGYQVCAKWLKDRQAKGGKNPRPGRILTDKDIDHYQKIIVALSETIRIMAEIDEVIEAHGGWPDAFQHESTECELDSTEGQQDPL